MQEWVRVIQLTYWMAWRHWSTQSLLTLADKLYLKMIAMEKLIEIVESSARDKLFSDWDVACDSRLWRELEHRTCHGSNLEVAIGVKFEAGAIFALVTITFELILGYSFTRGYSKTQAYEHFETLISIETDGPPGYKAASQRLLHTPGLWRTAHQTLPLIQWSGSCAIDTFCTVHGLVWSSRCISHLPLRLSLFDSIASLYCPTKMSMWL